MIVVALLGGRTGRFWRAQTRLAACAHLLQEFRWHS